MPDMATRGEGGDGRAIGGGSGGDWARGRGEEGFMFASGIRWKTFSHAGVDSKGVYLFTMETVRHGPWTPSLLILLFS